MKPTLITGAAGTIGQFLVHGIGFDPRGVEEVYLLDHAETPLFYLLEDARRRFPAIRWVGVLASTGSVFAYERLSRMVPDGFGALYHTAAYKHVSMCEANPVAAFESNILGTIAVLMLKAEHHIVVSTDKAAEPSSIMGASKLIAEHICAWAAKGGEVDGVLSAYTMPKGLHVNPVRLCNIYNSQGSVMPVWRDAIRRGENRIVVRGDDSTERMFINVDRAVEILRSVNLYPSGRTLIPCKLPAPTRIVDLARKTIGGEKVAIDFEPLLPGEKPSEILMSREEMNRINLEGDFFVLDHDGLFLTESMDALTQAAYEHNLAEFKKVLGCMAAASRHVEIKEKAQ